MLSLLWLALPAFSAQLELSAPELCGLSTHVVVGEVTSTEVLWSSGPEGGLETHVWLAVEAVVHGEPVDTVEIVFPGGERDGWKHWVEDTPELVPDRRYSLFVQQGEHGAQVVGGDQGAMQLKRSADVDAFSQDLQAVMGACHAP